MKKKHRDKLINLLREVIINKQIYFASKYISAETVSDEDMGRKCHRSTTYVDVNIFMHTTRYKR